MTNRLNRDRWAQCSLRANTAEAPTGFYFRREEEKLMKILLVKYLPSFSKAKRPKKKKKNLGWRRRVLITWSRGICGFFSFNLKNSTNKPQAGDKPCSKHCSRLSLLITLIKTHQNYLEIMGFKTVTHITFKSKELKQSRCLLLFIYVPQIKHTALL